MNETSEVLLNRIDKFNQYRLESMSTGDEWEFYNYEPKAGHIVNAFASYRLSHPLVRWYYKIKDLFNWRINIKLYKGD